MGRARDQVGLRLGLIFLFGKFHAWRRPACPGKSGWEYPGARVGEVDRAAGEPGGAEVDRAAGEHAAAEADLAAGEPGGVEVDRAAGEHAAAEADLPAGEPGAAEADRATAEPGGVEADLPAGELGLAEADLAAGEPGAGEAATIKDNAREVEVQALPGHRRAVSEMRADEPDDGITHFPVRPV